MGLTNFPNGITSFGVPVMGGGGIPAAWGDVYFVDYRNGDDTLNDGKTKANPFKTLSAAYAACTSNNNDLIIIDGDSTVVETAMITWSKNRITVIGANPGGHYGHAVKVSLGVTTVATDIALLKVTGVRNRFHGIKFMSSNTKDESLYTVVEAGEYSVYSNCEFYKFSDLNVTGASELVCNGDSPLFINCAIGSSANAISGAIIRANVLFTKGLGGTGKVTRDAYFENCILWRRSSNAANRFVYGANATDIERFCIFKNCSFLNAKNATGTPAQNVAFGASLTVGEVLLWDCVALNAGTAMSTTTGVFVQGYTPDATGGAAGIAIQTT